MKTDRIANAISTVIVAVLFAAIMAWFCTLLPAAIDRELDNQAAKVAAHMKMLER